MTRPARAILLALTLMLLAATPALGHHPNFYFDGTSSYVDTRCDTDRKVIVYRDVDLTGMRARICGDVHDLRDAHAFFIHDAVSSYAVTKWPTVGSGTWVLRFYRDVDFGGPYITKAANYDMDLHPEGWGDTISSVKWWYLP